MLERIGKFPFPEIAAIIGSNRTRQYRNKVEFRFLYTTTYTGLYEDAKRASSIIAIFENNKRLGHYYVGGGFSNLPFIENAELVTKYGDDNCNQVTKISYRDSIPQKIFIHCKEENGKMMGDVYGFEKEK